MINEMDGASSTRSYKLIAEQLVGHELAVEQTTDGKYVVMFMRFNQSPPPKADSENEAYKAFVEYYAKLPKGVPDANPTGSA